MPKLEIRAALMTEGDALTDLALRSKSHWKYNASYLDRCRPALLIDQSYLLHWPVSILEADQIIVGFFSLKTIQGEDRLDNLWVDLPYLGNGYGKILLFEAFIKAKELGWKKLRLAADPGAKTFYEKFGALQIGEVQSRIKSDLFLPHLEFSCL